MDSLVSALTQLVLTYPAWVYITDDTELIIGGMKLKISTAKGLNFNLSELTMSMCAKNVALGGFSDALCLCFTIDCEQFALTAIRTASIDPDHIRLALLSLPQLPSCGSREFRTHGPGFVETDRTIVRIRNKPGMTFCEERKADSKYINKLAVSYDYPIEGFNVDASSPNSLETHFAIWVDHPKLLPTATIGFPGWPKTPESCAMQARICAILKRKAV
jgi:hypothetical protein